MLNQIAQYKRIQEQTSESKQKLSVTNSNLNELSNQLAAISDDLTMVKVTKCLERLVWTKSVTE